MDGSDTRPSLKHRWSQAQLTIGALEDIKQNKFIKALTTFVFSGRGAIRYYRTAAQLC